MMKINRQRFLIAKKKKKSQDFSYFHQTNALYTKKIK